MSRARKERLEQLGAGHSEFFADESGEVDGRNPDAFAQLPETEAGKGAERVRANGFAEKGVGFREVFHTACVY